jgi:hypothetical protein
MPEIRDWIAVGDTTAFGLLNKRTKAGTGSGGHPKGVYCLRQSAISESALR